MFFSRSTQVQWKFDQIFRKFNIIFSTKKIHTFHKTMLAYNTKIGLSYWSFYQVISSNYSICQISYLQVYGESAIFCRVGSKPIIEPMLSFQ